MRKPLEMSIVMLAILFFSAISMPAISNESILDVENAQPQQADTNRALVDNSTIPVDDGGFTLDYVTTQPQNGQLYSDINPNTVVGKYGCLTEYDDTSGSEQNPMYFPSLIAKASSTGCYISKAEITVTGTKPNGQAITGIEFTNLDGIVSPNIDDDPEWSEALSLIATAIASIDPTGISDYIAWGADNMESGETLDVDNDEGNSAFGRFTVDNPIAGQQERGLQFRFSMHCDPNLPGIYTLNIHYRIQIHQRLYPPTSVLLISTDDFYDTIT